MILIWVMYGVSTTLAERRPRSQRAMQHPAAAAAAADVCLPRWRWLGPKSIAYPNTAKDGRATTLLHRHRHRPSARLARRYYITGRGDRFSLGAWKGTHAHKHASQPTIKHSNIYTHKPFRPAPIYNSINNFHAWIIAHQIYLWLARSSFKWQFQVTSLRPTAWLTLHLFNFSVNTLSSFKYFIRSKAWLTLDFFSIYINTLSSFMFKFQVFSMN